MFEFRTHLSFAASDKPPAAKEAKTITTLDECPTGSQLQITEAYFYHQAKKNYPCDIDCKPASPEDPPSLCFLLKERCRQRFSLRDLNMIYETVDSGAGVSELTKIDADHLERLGTYMVQYRCVDVNGRLSFLLLLWLSSYVRGVKIRVHKCGFVCGLSKLPLSRQLLLWSSVSSRLVVFAFVLSTYI